jgi:hypothetical protein
MRAGHHSNRIIINNVVIPIPSQLVVWTIGVFLKVPNMDGKAHSKTPACIGPSTLHLCGRMVSPQILFTTHSNIHTLSDSILVAYEHNPHWS